MKRFMHYRFALYCTVFGCGGFYCVKVQGYFMQTCFSLDFGDLTFFPYKRSNQADKHNHPWHQHELVFNINFNRRFWRFFECAQSGQKPVSFKNNAVF